MPDHEPFQVILEQPGLGASEPTEVSQVVKHLEVSPPDLGNGSSGHHRDGGACARTTQVTQVREGLVPVLVQDHNSWFHGNQ